MVRVAEELVRKLGIRGSLCVSSGMSVASMRKTLSSNSAGDAEPTQDDLLQIYDGFFFHYLLLVSESRPPPGPMATIMDRISWWGWLQISFCILLRMSCP